MRSLQGIYPNSNLLVEMYEIEESEQSASLHPSKQRKSSQSPSKSHEISHYSRRKMSQPQPSASGSAFAPNQLARVQGSQVPLNMPPFEKRQIQLATQLT